MFHRGELEGGGPLRKQMERRFLLWRGVLDEVNSLLNVRLEALDGNFEQFLLLFRGSFEHIDGFGRTVGLYLELANDVRYRKKSYPRKEKHTPSSTGTEKKSTPVALAMASPPGTPGR
jgi:hypothetical protein